MWARASFGSVALAAYLALFAAGMLVDSRPYRERIAPAAQATPASAPLEAGFGAAAAAAPGVSSAATPAFDAGAFLVSMALYTPINVALLTLLAGFLGGCASSITYSPAQLPAGAAVDDAAAKQAETRLLFRTESPFASMFRSFLVYLAFIAGIFITTSQPFENATADQYVRFAGTISLFAFVVGYDPTKLNDFLEFVPKRGK